MSHEPQQRAAVHSAGGGCAPNFPMAALLFWCLPGIHNTELLLGRALEELSLVRQQEERALQGLLAQLEAKHASRMEALERQFLTQAEQLTKQHTDAVAAEEAQSREAIDAQARALLAAVQAAPPSLAALGGAAGARATALAGGFRASSASPKRLSGGPVQPATAGADARARSPRGGKSPPAKAAACFSIAAVAASVRPPACPPPACLAAAGSPHVSRSPSRTSFAGGRPDSREQRTSSASEESGQNSSGTNHTAGIIAAGPAPPRSKPPPLLATSDSPHKPAAGRQLPSTKSGRPESPSRKVHVNIDQHPHQGTSPVRYSPCACGLPCNGRFPLTSDDE